MASSGERRRSQLAQSLKKPRIHSWQNSLLQSWPIAMHTNSNGLPHRRTLHGTRSCSHFGETRAHPLVKGTFGLRRPRDRLVRNEQMVSHYRASVVEWRRPRLWSREMHLKLQESANQQRKYVRVKIRDWKAPTAAAQHFVGCIFSHVGSISYDFVCSNRMLEAACELSPSRAGAERVHR